MKLRATITFEYDADPSHYSSDDPYLIAQIDKKNFEEDTSLIAEMADMAGYSVQVERVAP